METPELADAVSSLMQKLLSSGIPPRCLAEALRRGMETPELADAVSSSSGIPPGCLAEALRREVGVFGRFAAAIAEAREEPSPAELVQCELVRKQASDAEESIAVVSHIVRHGALNGAKVVCSCVGCGTKFECGCPEKYCCRGCRLTRGREHRHGSGPATNTCHRALPDVVNMRPLDAGWSNGAMGQCNHGDM